jgi:magnesium transporter
MNSPPSPTAPAPDTAIDRLLSEVARRSPHEAADFLKPQPDEAIAQVLAGLNSRTALQILERFRESGREEKIVALAPPMKQKQWRLNAGYPQDSVGRLMEPPHALFSPDLTVAEAVEQLREMVKTAFITYGYTVDEVGKLLGVIVMRELLLARPDQRLRELMLRDPFFLNVDMSVADAIRAVLNRHYPVYPVCDEAGRIIGLVRGYVLFEQQAVEISAQAGAMVGVEREERLTTPWQRSLRFRHPWLQLNLLTAFIAAAVVGAFQNTIDQIVVLAAFLPVLAGQSGNTGCQALAVTLRGMTLGELRRGGEKRILAKEALLGLSNGALVGLTAGIGMYVFARMNHNAAALTLAFVVFVAMTASCVVSGVSGVLVPVTLKRLGADPATASSIFLTTATDVASMGMFLYLATRLLT